MSDHNFNTPPELIERIRLLSDIGDIGLDPCSNAHSLVGARWNYCGVNGPKDDGLAHTWRGHGLVFMNPPHSMSPNNIEPWMLKAHAETYDLDIDDQFVGLIPAKTDTARFHDYACKFRHKCFLRGRPKFWLNGNPMPGPGKFASMLIYAGAKPGKFVEIFEDMGWIV